MHFMFTDVGLHLLVGHEIGIRSALGVGFDEVIGTVTGLALLAVHLGIGEGSRVAAGLPDAGIHEDRRIYAVRIFALVDEALPPSALDVVFDLDADGAVVPSVAHAAVDLGAGEDDAARLAQRNEFVH